MTWDPERIDHRFTFLLLPTPTNSPGSRGIGDHQTFFYYHPSVANLSIGVMASNKVVVCGAGFLGARATSELLWAARLITCQGLISLALLPLRPDRIAEYRYLLVAPKGSTTPSNESPLSWSSPGAFCRPSQRISLAQTP